MEVPAHQHTQDISKLPCSCYCIIASLSSSCLSYVSLHMGEELAGHLEAITNV